MVAVKVGAAGEQRTFSIHKNLLTSHSEFFEGILSNNIKREYADGAFELKDTDGHIFENFQRFLYTGAIYSASDERTDERTENASTDAEYDRLVQC